MLQWFYSGNDFFLYSNNLVTLTFKNRESTTKKQIKREKNNKMYNIKHSCTIIFEYITNFYQKYMTNENYKKILKNINFLSYLTMTYDIMFTQNIKT
ncbi:hypothetical protein BpHYR1_025591 [Brachionus plicatilis]|uniref:Uncharacterized protein n=1 Tax=Brachionus plicatilis TaxID=10195 RepID=A0A3M7S4M0_BRAPC|nr:hypothetical protein BpHYR1_025591 [Brachionus plicatilis]